MAAALLFASRFLTSNSSPRSQEKMVLLLADGANDCGDVGAALGELRASRTIFRHETVGFGIEPGSQAAQDLRQVATSSGGQFHHAANAAQLSDVLLEFVDTFSLLDMLGMFGKPASTSQLATRARQSSAPQKSTSGPQESTSSGLRSMVGSFRRARPTDPGPPEDIVSGASSDEATNQEVVAAIEERLGVTSASTAIHEAARQSDIATIQELLAAGADVNNAGNSEGTPLHIAARYASAETIRTLVAMGADLEDDSNITGLPLHVAAGSGRAEAVRTLLAAGAGPNWKENLTLRTALHVAAVGCQSEMVETLLRAGADPAASDNTRQTRLHLVANRRWNCQEIARALLAAGAGPEARNSSGARPLDLAPRASAVYRLLAQWPQP